MEKLILETLVPSHVMMGLDYVAVLRGSVSSNVVKGHHGVAMKLDVNLVGTECFVKHIITTPIVIYELASHRKWPPYLCNIIL